jgi:hypothetical protein
MQCDAFHVNIRYRMQRVLAQFFPSYFQVPGEREKFVPR